MQGGWMGGWVSWRVDTCAGGRVNKKKALTLENGEGSLYQQMRCGYTVYVDDAVSPPRPVQFV